MSGRLVSRMPGLFLMVLFLLSGCDNLVQPKIPPSTTLFSVTFNSNGGTAIASLTGIVSGSKISAPIAPTKANNVFGGWFKDVDCTDAWDFAVDTVTTNTTLHASWVQVYSVTFNSNGGTAIASLTGVVSGSKISAPIAPTKANSVFGGWFKDVDCTDAWDFAFDTVTANTTLYARWTQVFSVTFNSNGGTAIASLTGVVSGSKISDPTAPTKAGHLFGGWFKDVACTLAWDFAVDTVTANTTLYASWTAVGTGGISVTDPSTGAITFSGQASTLPFGVSMAVTATVSGTAQSYTWYLDGVADLAQTTATWTGGSNLIRGPHSLMVVVKVQGILYSNSLDFTVQ